MDNGLEQAITGGIVFKGMKQPPKGVARVRTKAKKKAYITGLHNSGAARKKAEIRRERANRHKK